MRPEKLNFLFRDVTSLHGTGQKTAGFLRKLCGPCLVDLLFHAPIGVIHRPFKEQVTHITSGSHATVHICIDGHIVPHTRRQPYKINAHLVKTAEPVELVFFNYRNDYLEKTFLCNKTYFISGKMETNGFVLKILHPDYVSHQLNDIPEFESVYPLTIGLTNKGMNKSIQYIVSQTPDLPEWQDMFFVQKRNWPSWKQAISQLHQPQCLSDIQPQTPSRLRLAYDELLANQLTLFLARHKRKKQIGQKLPPIQDNGLVKRFLTQLPFELTSAQKRVISEIQTDLSADIKMTRLLQGDVGSGKTVVALIALLQAVEGGMQGVLMVPTDILAHQHFNSIQKMTACLGIRTGLLTGREKGKKRTQICQALANGELDILIGTHAVFSDDVIYHQLAVAIIDEQHKFGVQQRLALTQKQPNVNVLVMTATPIPRTLALTAYGDMDVSVLDEKPANRKPIETRVMPMTKAVDLSEKLFQKIRQSEQRLQVYWVCPLVEESEKSDLMAAEKRFEILQDVFGHRVGLVHGKMSGSQKDGVMNQFITGQLDVLVATTVIEVGVDVPTASVIVIEQAERFGLAALHQLRGRVGRGGTQSNCILLYGKQLSQTAQARLKIMRETDNGFLIAEEDLRLRGAGEILGSRQSGLQTFLFADLNQHGDLLYTATQDAKMILNTDPMLTSSRGQALRQLLYLFRQDKHIQTLKAG